MRAEADSRHVSDAHNEQPPTKAREVIITGGTTAIGRSIAALLAAKSVKFRACGRPSAPLGDALARRRGVSEGDGARSFAAETYLLDPKVDAINPAAPVDALAETGKTDIRHEFAFDITSFLVSSQPVIKRMQPGADINLIELRLGLSKRRRASNYTADESGIEVFAPCLRAEYARKDIKVGLIEPGFMRADFQYSHFPPKKHRELIAKDSMLRAEDIGAVAHFTLTLLRPSAMSPMQLETRFEHP